MQKPSIFDFMDINDYLQTVYKFRKSLNKKFSYSVWSEELGPINSTLLRFMVQGKRNISANSVEKLAFSLGLNPLEQKYFEMLVKHKNAKTIGEKTVFSKELIKLQRMTFAQNDIKTESISLRPNLIPIVTTLLSFSDQKFTTAAIARIFNLNAEAAADLIEYMHSKNLLSVSENNELSATSANFKIADTFNSQELKKYYVHWIDESKKAIDLKPEIRRFRSLIVPLSQDQFTDFVEQLNDFAMTQLSKYQSDELQGKNLYMFNTALFPVVGDLTAQPARHQPTELVPISVIRQ